MCSGLRYRLSASFRLLTTWPSSATIELAIIMPTEGNLNKLQIADLARLMPSISLTNLATTVILPYLVIY
jgi:hypothetical protein